jgi:outer membrane biosynthesis protein TonB
MMRLWVQSYSRQSTSMPIAALSGILHAIIIAAWVVATLPPSSTADDDSLSNRVYPQYVPPPDKVPGGPAAVHEVVHFVTLTGAAVGDGVGQGGRTAGNKPPSPADEAAARVDRDTTLDPKPVTAPPPPPGNSDSVFTVLDVDTAVVRSANSAAPAYPLKLLEARITGSVQAQYVVDTTGFADTASFRVMKSTNPGFVEAVREALPYMRFKPAKIGPLKVRQLVEQTFTFRITAAETTTAAPRVKKP